MTFISRRAMTRLAALLAFLPAVAHAQAALTPQNSKWLPPPEYDKPFAGKLLTIERGDAKEMTARCPKTVFTPTLACTWRRENGERCDVLIANDDLLKAQGWTYEHVWRHERAHCVGWPQSHPGQRKGTLND